MMRQFRFLQIALVCVMPLSGCSLLFTKPPPKNYDGRGYLDCTTSRVPPALDTIFTLTNVGSAIYVAGQDNVQNKGSSVALGLGVAALWMMSAIYGYSGTSACEEAQQSVGYGSRYPPPRPAPRRVAPPPPRPAPVAPAPQAAPAPAPGSGPDGGTEGPFVVPDNPRPAAPKAPVQQQWD